MLIIIEWADLMGKTTLIKKLKVIFWDAISFKIPKDVIPKWSDEIEKNKIFSWYKTLLEVIDLYLKQKPNSYVIQDRFYIMSEIVYWKIFRNYDVLDTEYYQKIKNKLKEIPHLLVYLSDDYKNAEKRFLSNWDDVIKSIEKYKKIFYEYDNVFNKIKNEKDLNILKIEPFNDNDHVNKIINKILKIKEIHKINNDNRERNAL